MAAGDDESYKAGVEQMHQLAELLEQVEQEPPSSERDQARKFLHDEIATAILRVCSLGTTTLS